MLASFERNTLKLGCPAARQAAEWDLMTVTHCTPVFVCYAKHNRTSLRRLRGALPVLALALSACVGAPVQEMSDARQAIWAAESAGAEANPDGDLSRARQSLNEAEAELQGGHYGDARRLAEDAKEAALRARRAALEQPP